MRQIAVLPYRFGGPAQDGPTEILLITSRETKRWVVPKGNPLNGMPRHAAAAVEAEEEAGVIGAVCPTPIGSYEYRKRRANRSEEHTSELQSLMRISYAVFCLKKKNETTTTQ